MEKSHFTKNTGVTIWICKVTALITKEDMAKVDLTCKTQCSRISQKSLGCKGEINLHAKVIAECFAQKRSRQQQLTYFLSSTTFQLGPLHQILLVTS